MADRNITLKEFDLGCETRDFAKILIPQVNFNINDFERVEGRVFVKNFGAVKKVLDDVLQIAEIERSNLVVFPELSIPENFVDELRLWSAGKDCLVVAGTHYKKADDGHFLSHCPIIFDGIVFDQKKSFAAPVERSAVDSKGLTESSCFPIFRNTPLGSFANFICADYLNNSLREQVTNSNIDLYSIISWQKNSKEYHQRLDINVKDIESGIYGVYCNASIDSFSDGGSALFGVMDRDLYREDLEDANLAALGYDNMICSAPLGQALNCHVNLSVKRPVLGRTASTHPNVIVGRIETIAKRTVPLDLQSVDLGQTSKITIGGDEEEPEQPSNDSDVRFSYDALQNLHDTLDLYRSELLAREERGESSLDSHSAADELAVRLSQSIFYEKGLLFLFKASISVTNLQYSELISLIRANSVSIQHDHIEFNNYPLNFISTAELRKSLAETWVSLVPDREAFLNFINTDDHYDSISQTIINSLANMVSFSCIVDVFDCSAVVFPCPGIVIEIETVLKQSGFIHSVGNLIYVRNVKKSSVGELSQNLSEYVKTAEVSDGNKIPFCMYCFEIFDEYETPEEYLDTAGGINDLKFHSEKFFLGGQPIYAFREKIHQDPLLNGRLKFISSDRDYHEQFKEIRGTNNGTIWMFRDRRASESADNFIICYHQILVNADPYLQAEEDKPAWLGPVTLPHSLASAMLSLSRPYFDIAENPIIIDPFVGSGTTLFEAQKMFPKPIFFGGDINRAATFAISDNRAILSNYEGISDDLLESLEAIVDMNVGDGQREKFHEKYGRYIHGETLMLDRERRDDWAVAVFDRCSQFVKNQHTSLMNGGLDPYRAVRALGGVSVAEIFDNFPGQTTLRERILVYCFWKATLKNAPAFLEGRRRASDKVFQEIVNLVRFIRRIKSGVRSVRDAQIDGNYLFSDGVRPEIAQSTDGDFGPDTKIYTGTIEGEMSSFFNKLPEDVKTNGVDIIFTDPPYGFNTDHNNHFQLLSLFDNLIEKIVSVVGSRTHLLLCLPEQSHNGQILPSFVTRAWFMPRLMQEAEAGGVEVIDFVKFRPELLGEFGPVYYWRSERALTRSVIHVIMQRVRS